MGITGRRKRCWARCSATWVPASSTAFGHTGDGVHINAVNPASVDAPYWRGQRSGRDFVIDGIDGGGTST